MTINSTQSAAPIQKQTGAGAGKPSVGQYVQQKATKTLGPKVQADLVKDLKSGSYEKFVSDIESLPADQRLKALNDLRMKNPDQYGQLLDGIRDKKVSNEDLKTGVALDRIRNSTWADSEEGKATLKQLEKQYAAGNIHVVNKSEMDKEERAMGATPADASIQIAREVMDAPDAAAAVLAHEGMHSMHNATSTKGKTMVAEETAGNMVMAKVWTELQGASGFKRTGIAEEASLDKTASHYDSKMPEDTADMKKYVKDAYTEFHKK